jgi:DNA-binding transcriptional ArsR family regulator
MRKFLLTYSYMGMYSLSMARASTTSDAFNAVAEPRRRDILNYLALQERSVGDIVDSLSMEQPSVSKHLRVLKDVGLVQVRRDGRRMFYRTNAEAIRPLHEWTSTFERFWRHQLNRIKERAESKNKPSNISNFIPRSKDDLDRDKN